MPAPQPVDAATARRIDELCDQFEGGWRTGRQAAIETVLEKVDARYRGALLRELLLLEWDILLERGQPPQPGQYYRRFPQEQRLVQDVFAEFQRASASSNAAGLEAFIAAMDQSGLVAADTVHGVLEQLPDDQRVDDTLSLTRALIRAQQLTAYQAKTALQGRMSELFLDEYVLLERIGQGGMGEVFLARHRSTRRLVAIKLLSTFAQAIPEAIARFEREAELTSRLTHPGIVRALQFGQARGIPFLAMEYIDGRDLARSIERGGPLRVDRAVDFIFQAAEALDYAHQRGVVHRDIKPANVIVDRNRKVHILDMGLALPRSADDLQGSSQGTASSTRLTTDGYLLGTVDYMAPEQAGDARRADMRSDIYSLGCTLFYSLVGRPPYSGDTPTAIVLAHQDAPIPSIRSHRPETPAALESLYLRMVTKDRHRRLARMADVVDLAGEILKR